MDAKNEILRKVLRDVKNRVTNNYTFDDDQHAMAEQCLMAAAEKYGLSHCGVEVFERDGNYRKPTYYLNFGDIYDQTILVELFATAWGGHKIRIGSVGAELERYL